MWNTIVGRHAHKTIAGSLGIATVTARFAPIVIWATDIIDAANATVKARKKKRIVCLSERVCVTVENKQMRESNDILDCRYVVRRSSLRSFNNANAGMLLISSNYNQMRRTSWRWQGICEFHNDLQYEFSKTWHHYVAHQTRTHLGTLCYRFKDRYTQELARMLLRANWLVCLWIARQSGNH
ncbi:uncharacterized protein F5891DRAFT_1175315 [Suillus fuscotomentosus]|uniref:Uncharacterized protein n=1 Tax=Suillus fuscotomentosus TaxID=1912939 RepID=A0AAD4HFW1_9AGAM|nr:uncharacterized protein F5891DRAFT_1175315 [Suillus fuscotomentosus]KAG1896115.1 hypothetical protein F5891DRAFT_1175315 [Suillus fuscotomentosus]